jgi:hypothetical protein
MLRREFIRNAGVVVGAGVIIYSVPGAFEFKAAREKSVRRSNLHFHGHPRSGCASRPEIVPLLENGITAFPAF